MPSNTAAWLVTAKQKPFEIKSAEYTAPGANEIVVKNAALGINPIDWKMQDLARFPLNYPAVLGADLAGEVVEVGSAITRFKAGDRVVGYGSFIATKNTANSAFQQYTVVPDNLASPIPDSLSFETAAVLPTGLSTASCGLFQSTHLGLQHPTSGTPKPTGQVVLVWGGSGSVGSNGIQLAVAAGYEVIATASAKNFDFVRSLGASQAFDYNSPTIVSDLAGALKGKTLAGVLDTITINGVVQKIAEVLVESQNTDKVIASVLGGQVDLPGAVVSKGIFGLSLKDNEVGKAIWEDYLPAALKEGKYIPSPKPVVVGKGLESIQGALEQLKAGVSAQKLVVLL